MNTWNRWIVEWSLAIWESFSDANKSRHQFQTKACPLPGMYVWASISYRYPRRMMIIKLWAFHCTLCNIWITPTPSGLLSTFKINNNRLLSHLIITSKISRSSLKKFIKPMKLYMKRRSHLISSLHKIQASSRDKQQILKVTLCWKTSNRNRQMTLQWTRWLCTRSSWYSR